MPPYAPRMAVTITWTDPDDPARLIDALLTAAVYEDRPRPLVARRYRRMVDELGDALDRELPRLRTLRAPWELPEDDGLLHIGCVHSHLRGRNLDWTREPCTEIPDRPAPLPRRDRRSR